MNYAEIKAELNAKALEFFMSPKLGEDGKPILVDKNGKSTTDKDKGFKVPSGYNRAKTLQSDFIVAHDDILEMLAETGSATTGLYLKRKPEIIFTDDKGREEVCRVFVLCHSEAVSTGTF